MATRYTHAIVSRVPDVYAKQPTVRNISFIICLNQLALIIFPLFKFSYRAIKV